MWIEQHFTLAQGQVNGHNILTCPKKKFTCHKGWISRKKISLAFTVLIPNVNFFENSMKPDRNSIENSVNPDQLASEEAS